ncbi:hypothetical protein HPB48_013816 [Haemaphysalis longicornis]|uniref:Peptidoglycan recognition protein n=1 Tax=Haemaphysalis longicornis TaxID=44386 RepID=A0A9J6GM52_HAELO|nr:hypothetical protein HPB48_013816 [Haemaphysalis longicornis]
MGTTGVEAVFDLHRVIRETTRFRHLLCNLPPEVDNEAADVIGAPLGDAPYQRLKQSILDRTTASESARLRHVLFHEELGDRRPSQLLNTMRQLVGASNVDSNVHMRNTLAPDDEWLRNSEGNNAVGAPCRIVFVSVGPAARVSLSRLSEELFPFPNSLFLSVNLKRRASRLVVSKMLSRTPPLCCVIFRRSKVVRKRKILLSHSARTRDSRGPVHQTGRKGGIFTERTKDIESVKQVLFNVKRETQMHFDLATNSKRHLLIKPMWPPWDHFYRVFLACSGIPFVTRQEWGARPPRDPPKRLRVQPVRLLFVHHTTEDECLDFASCSAKMRYWQDFHMDTRGWDDLGYSFLIGGDGRVYVSRGWDRSGRHTFGYNDVALAVSFMGDFSRRLPSRAALWSLYRLIQCGLAQGKIHPSFTLHGHRDSNCGTTCPGDALYMHIRQWPHYEWWDIGYSFVIGGDGRVYQGRGFGVESAHTKGYNRGGISIAFIGDYRNTTPSDKMLAAAQKLIDCGMEQGYISPDYQLHGHRDAICTESPGTALYEIIKSWPHYAGRLDTYICGN